MSRRAADLARPRHGSLRGSAGPSRQTAAARPHARARGSRSPRSSSPRWLRRRRADPVEWYRDGARVPRRTQPRSHGHLRAHGARGRRNARLDRRHRPPGQMPLLVARPRLTLRSRPGGGGRVDRLAGLEHRDELLEPAGARLGPLRVLEPVEDRVAVAAVEPREERRRRRARVELALEVVRHGDRALARRRRRPSARRPSRARPRRRPAGRMRPAAVSASTLARLIFDQLLRARRGVKRWRKWSSSSLLRTASIQPKQSALVERLGVGDRRVRRRPCARSSATPLGRRRDGARARPPTRRPRRTSEALPVRPCSPATCRDCVPVTPKVSADAASRHLFPGTHLPPRWRRA